IYDPDAAADLGAERLDGETAKLTLFTNLRQAYEGILPAKCQAPGITGQADDGVALARFQIDGIQIATARIEDKETPTVPARRMGHREPAADHLAAGNIEDHAAGRLVRPPAFGGVCFAESRDKSRPAIADSKAVQMTGVVRRQV